jgi:succinate-semialdehyde dehydrogenase/glutarate-semialdehyde dehydrogenase
MRREQNFIAGAWASASDGSVSAVTNPATGRIIGHVPVSTIHDVEAAISAASSAFENFRSLTASARADHLLALHAEILRNAADLAELLTEEQGKPLAEARAEIGMSAAYVRWYAEEARRVGGEIIASPWPDRRLLVTRHPVGVVAAITPWNFPSSMLARKIAPALAAGCTVVAKPAPQTPFSALAWGVLCQSAGLPPGVVNIVTGDAALIGGAFMESADVRKVTFTGSTAVGKLLTAQAASTLKKVSMELGGNAPFIIFDDADLHAAVAGAIAAKFRNTGQTCVCANRIYVQRGIHDAFLANFAIAVRALKVGSGISADSDQGPLIDSAAVEKVERYIEDALSHGATLETGGARIAGPGSFFAPTVISNAKDTMLCAQNEVFGPLAPVLRFDTEREVLSRANAVEAGLAAYVYTKDLGRAFRMSQGLDYGIVGINEGVVTTEVAPFGGMKQSGTGREGGRQGIEDYLETKYVCMGGLAS